MQFKSFVQVAAAVGLALCATSGEARVWKPSAVEQISDYLFIVDPKPDGSQVMVFWIDPRVGGEDDDQVQLRKWIGNRILIGIAEVDIKDGSSMMPRKVAEPQIMIGGQQRPAVEQGAFDAGLKQASDFARGLIGTAGQTFRFFAVSDTKLDACGTGSLQVAYGGERYAYRAPAPGCPKRP